MASAKKKTLGKKGSATEIDFYVGSQLRLRRKLLGLSQMDVAEALDITFQQIQKYENGKNRISAGKLFEASQYLNVSTDYFFEDCFGNKRALDEVKGRREEPLNSEAIKLINFFNSIKDAKLRKNLLDHAKVLAKAFE